MALEINRSTVYTKASVTPSYSAEHTPTLTFEFTEEDEIGNTTTQKVQVSVLTAILLWDALLDILTPLAELYASPEEFEAALIAVAEEEKR